MQKTLKNHKKCIEKNPRKFKNNTKNTKIENIQKKHKKAKKLKKCSLCFACPEKGEAPPLILWHWYLSLGKNITKHPVPYY